MMLTQRSSSLGKAYPAHRVHPVKFTGSLYFDDAYSYTSLFFWAQARFFLFVGLVIFLIMDRPTQERLEQIHQRILHMWRYL